MKRSIKTKIISVAIGPILMLGLLTIIITLTLVKGALMDEVQESLRATASSILAAYDQNQGNYLEGANGDIWKGAYSISASEKLVDTIKEKIGVDATFYWGDRCIMTSVKDAQGQRVMESATDSAAIQKVLEGGEEYFCEVNVHGVDCYGYYMPVYQSYGNKDVPLGMIFAAVNKAEKDSAVAQIISIIVGVVAAVMLVCVALSLVVSATLTRSIKKSVYLVESVAKGELGVKVDPKFLKMKDEVGDLSRALQLLQTQLHSIIENISDNVNIIRTTSEQLNQTATETKLAMLGVNTSVTSVAESAVTQADTSRNVSVHISDMGDRISRTAVEVKALNQNASMMQTSGESAVRTMQELCTINDEVKTAVEIIRRQTNQTNESAQKIKKAASIIAEIAEETNLLSLNASIEAARAGESGRGFAVVAAQIQKLAEQSNQSGNEITRVIDELIRDSDETVSTMERVQEIILTQNDNMVETEHVVGEVTDGIIASIESIKRIGHAADELDNARSAIVGAVNELSELSRQNMEITQETDKATTEVSNSFEQVGENAVLLNKIAEELAVSMEYFRI